MLFDSFLTTTLSPHPDSQLIYPPTLVQEKMHGKSANLLRNKLKKMDTLMHPHNVVCGLSLRQSKLGCQLLLIKRPIISLEHQTFLPFFFLSKITV